jgi:hypothetical protein
MSFEPTEPRRLISFADAAALMASDVRTLERLAKQDQERQADDDDRPRFPRVVYFRAKRFVFLDELQSYMVACQERPPKRKMRKRNALGQLQSDDYKPVEA